MTIKLHCFGESGNAYKAALTMTLAGVEWEPVFVDFFNGASRTPEFRALNIMGEVPVMVDGDLVISQSAVIQDYITSKTSKLGGKSADQRREVLRWMFLTTTRSVAWPEPCGSIQIFFQRRSAAKRLMTFF